MKKRIVMSVLLLGFILITLGVGGSYLYQQRTKVASTETTYYGDSSVMEGIKFTYTVQDNQEYRWKTMYSFSNGLKSQTKFSTEEIPVNYFAHYDYYLQATVGEGDKLEEYLNSIWSDQIERKKYYLYKYDPYVKITLSGRIGFSKVSCGKLLQVKVPKSSYVDVIGDNQSVTYQKENFPSIRLFEFPKKEIDGITYMTIANYQDPNGHDHLEYQGMSGIIAFPSSMLEEYPNENQLTMNHVLYPLEIGSEIDRQIVGFGYHEEKGWFVLPVKEGDKLSLHIIDKDTGDLLCKNVVAYIPENAIMQSFQLFFQENLILADYKYTLGEKEEQRHVVSAYEVETNQETKEKQGITVLLQKDLTKDIVLTSGTLSEKLSVWDYVIDDMYYKEGMLYVIGKEQEDYYFLNYGIIAMALEKESGSVRYLGEIHNSAEEDYTVCFGVSDVKYLTDPRSRVEESLQFQR